MSALVDTGLVGKNFAKIERYVQDLRTLARPEEIQRDIRERRFIEWTLQLAIRAMLDTASYIVSYENLGEPCTPRDLIGCLERNGWIASTLAFQAGELVSLRESILYHYDDMDLTAVEDAVRNHLDDLLEFVQAVRARLLSPLVHRR